MKTAPSSANSSISREPFEIVKEGSVSVPIYRHINIIPQRDAAGKIIYGSPRADGKPQALVKYQSYIYTISHYEGAKGSKRVRQKFSDLNKARQEAQIIANRLANYDGEAIKLKGSDRLDYIRAMRLAREWKPDANLYQIVFDHIAFRRKLPDNVPSSDVADVFLKRHPTGLPVMTVRQVVDELIDAKDKAGKSDVYIKDLTSRLGNFADHFNVRITTVTGSQIEKYIRGLKTLNKDESERRQLSGRTQNNIRRLISTLFKFAVKRGYLPKDHDEINAVDKATVDSGEIEVFSPGELQKLFDACLKPVKERGKWRTREEMIPYLAVAAFCGLRAAEIMRLDWSEIHLTGSEKFIEVTAGKAKTASRRTVPLTNNCAAWLERYAKSSGPVIKLSRADKQLFLYLANKSGVPWKHNGLRHSFISYRLAAVKDVGQVSLEAGNSPGMVFKHYRQLVRESEAQEWFGIMPPKQEEGTTTTATNTFEPQSTDGQGEATGTRTAQRN